MATSLSPSTGSSPSATSVTSEAAPTVTRARGNRRSTARRTPLVIPEGTTTASCDLALRTETDPAKRKELLRYKRVIANRKAAFKSREAKRIRMQFLEQQAVQQQAMIANLQAHNAQMAAAVQQANNTLYLWQERAYQAQHPNLPSVANAMEQLQIQPEHTVLPSHPGWGIDPRRVNNSPPTTFTQEYEVGLDAAMAKFS